MEAKGRTSGRWLGGWCVFGLSLPWRSELCLGVSFSLHLEDQFRYRILFSLATCRKGHLKSHLPRKPEFEWGQSVRGHL